MLNVLFQPFHVDIDMFLHVHNIKRCIIQKESSSYSKLKKERENRVKLLFHSAVGGKVKSDPYWRIQSPSQTLTADICWVFV